MVVVEGLFMIPPSTSGEEREGAVWRFTVPPDPPSVGREGAVWILMPPSTGAGGIVGDSKMRKMFFFIWLWAKLFIDSETT